MNLSRTRKSPTSQLPSLNEAISRRRQSLFGHVRRMDQAASAHQALHLSVTSRQGSGQFGTWRRQPGRPRKCWVEQVTTSTGLSPSDAWGVATDRSARRALRPIDGQPSVERERGASLRSPGNGTSRRINVLYCPNCPD